MRHLLDGDQYEIVTCAANRAESFRLFSVRKCMRAAVQQMDKLAGAHLVPP